MRLNRLWAVLAVLALVLAACTEAVDETTTTAAAGDDGGGDEAPTGASGDVVGDIMDRGMLNCGVNDAVPGFGFTDEGGEFSGFDVDYCRAIAAAVLGDPDAVEFTPLTAQQRFTALQSGEIDVLVRNTTWTATRDGQEGANFATTTFYDGQGMMVRSDAGISAIEDLEGSAICVLSGTTTELNLATRMAGMDFEPLTFEDNETLQEAFVAGQCDGWTSDKSQLAGVRSAFPEGEGGPEALTILEETFSKEPLGPVTADGDSEWSQMVDWVVLATIQAEEFGITSDNVDTFSDTDDLAIRRFLGLEFEDDEGNTTTFDPQLGFDRVTWVQDVISAVGNYGEIFERNVGPDTALGLERGLNALWTEGGLLYAPPYR